MYVSCFTLPFQNEVSSVEEKQLGEVEVYQKTFSLIPTYSPGKHWVAIMDEAKEHKTKNFCHPTPRLYEVQSRGEVSSNRGKFRKF